MKGSDVESITKLLKAHEVPLSAVRANRLLIALGLLEEATRESATRPGVVKTYKVVTEAGLDFGVNEKNPQSPDQSSPYWYRDSFAELAARLVAADRAERSGKTVGGGTGTPTMEAEPGAGADEDDGRGEGADGGAGKGTDDGMGGGADDGAGGGTNSDAGDGTDDGPDSRAGGGGAEASAKGSEKRS